MLLHLVRCAFGLRLVATLIISQQRRQQHGHAAHRQRKRNCLRLCSPGCALRGGRCNTRQLHPLSSHEQHLNLKIISVFEVSHSVK